MTITQTEFDSCAQQLMSNYMTHADRLKQLSADLLAEIQLKATIRNDIDQMIVAELANN